MDNVSLHQFLVLYTWFPLAALLLFLLLIARFYEKFSNFRTYFWLYGLVAVLFGAMSVRHASVGIVLGDVAMDAIAFVSGLLLLFLVCLLYIRMMNSANDKDSS